MIIRKVYTNSSVLIIYEVDSVDYLQSAFGEAAPFRAIIFKNGPLNFNAAGQS